MQTRPATNVEVTDDRDGIDLLDFLFTVALSIGLTPELLQQGHLTGVLSQDWVQCLFQPRQTQCTTMPSMEDWFNICVVLLGLISLTFSWWGYHNSVAIRPLRRESILGMIRFLLDIVLVALYGLTLVFFRSFYHVAAFMMLIFILYFVWDMVKVAEYRADYRDNNRWIWSKLKREFVSPLWATVFVILWLFSMRWTGWGLLVIYVLCVFLFRLHKKYPWPGAFRHGLGSYSKSQSSA
jgi:hypothetical protein